MGRGPGRACILLGLLATALTVAPTAHAATLSPDPDTGAIVYVAAPGEANDVTIGYDPVRAEYTFTDGGASLAFPASSGSRNTCRNATAGIACTGLRVSALRIALGDRDDRLAADVDVPLRVDGGAGADWLLCGSGADAVVPDPADVVAANCDGAASDPPADPDDPATSDDPADRGADEPAGLDLPTDADGTPIPAPDLVLPVRPVTLDEPGIVNVELGCSAAAAAACSGDIYVQAPARHFVRRHGSLGAARGRDGLRQRRLGHRHFRIEQGKSATTRVPLLRGHYVIRNRRKRVRGRVLVVQRDASGKVLGSTSRPVVLERKWSRRGKQRRRR